MDAIFELGQVKQIAAALWNEGKRFKVWAFYAEMGTGKTTLIHALTDHLHVADAVSSPTFSIINEYASPEAGTIFHMDWYRLQTEEEAIRAGVEDHLLSGNYCLIEWPEKAPGLLPEICFHVYMETLDVHTRRLYTNDKVLSEKD